MYFSVTSLSFLLNKENPTLGALFRRMSVPQLSRILTTPISSGRTMIPSIANGMPLLYGVSTSVFKFSSDNRDFVTPRSIGRFCSIVTWYSLSLFTLNILWMISKSYLGGTRARPVSVASAVDSFSNRSPADSSRASSMDRDSPRIVSTIESCS